MTDPDSMSLVETGCTLWVGDVGARTSTLGATKVKRRSTSTCAVSPAVTSNGADVVATNPGRVASTT